VAYVKAPTCLGCVWGLWFSGSQSHRIQARGLARATAEAVGVTPGPGIYPRGYPPRDTVTFRQYFRRKTQFVSTSIWAGGPGGPISPAKGALGGRYRRFIGETMALHAITCAPLPNEAMMWQIMSACPPAPPPKPVGYPPIFVVRRPSGGPQKSMYSKVAGISETDGKNRRYASSSRFVRQSWCQGQLNSHSSEASLIPSANRPP